LFQAQTRIQSLIYFLRGAVARASRFNTIIFMAKSLGGND